MPAFSVDNPPASVEAVLGGLRTGLSSKIPAKHQSSNLLIGTWNIRAFGGLTEKWESAASDSPKRNLADVCAIAEIISRFDVVALQETRDDLSALRTLMRRLGSRWSFIVTDVGAERGGHPGGACPPPGRDRLAAAHDRGGAGRQRHARASCGGDLVSKRFSFYGRLSTTDKQDPSLSFPSQRKACEHKVAELGGEVTCEFTDQESGAKQERPGWSALTQEARDLGGRRFDAVVIYSTSRLARDRLYAALFERELDKVGVTIHYAMGAGDPDTPEGKVFIGMQQIWDEFERNKLSRETKRGMREASEQGYRAGGRPPYGYRRREQELPEDHKGDREKRRVTLEPEPEEAKVVAEIFDLFVDGKHSPKAIANHLNQPGGPPSPRHVDPSRNLRGHWAASTIRAMLQNPVYTGRTVWNRLDFTEAKHAGGGARRRRQGGVGDRRGGPPAARHRRDLRGSPEALLDEGARERKRPFQERLRPLRDGSLLLRARTAGDGGQAAQGSHLLRLRVRRQLRRYRSPGGPWRSEVHLRPRGPAAAAGPSLLRAAHLRAAAP